MNKKRGFTLIEVAVTFSLISVIVILLFQIIISLREVYIKGDLQTTLLSRQGILTKKINDDFQNLKLKSITSCGKFCITITYMDNSAYNLSLDIDKNQIKYHDYTWQLPEGSSIGTVETQVVTDTTSTGSTYNSILLINIPVTHKLLEQDYGIRILYQFSNGSVSIPTSIPKPTDVTNEQHQKYSFFR